jgi:hypothetical protein
LAASPDFKPSRDPSNEQLQEELKDKVEQVRAARAEEGTVGEVSKSARSPMLAGVMDSQTGKTFFAGNTAAVAGENPARPAKPPSRPSSGRKAGCTRS